MNRTIFAIVAVTMICDWSPATSTPQEQSQVEERDPRIVTKDILKEIKEREELEQRERERDPEAKKLPMNRWENQARRL